jgi:phospholipase C
MSTSDSIKHIVVLMLENRSFDQMLGFSHIQGTDAVTGKPTEVDGLVGTEYNPSSRGGMVKVTRPADFVANADPGHEFTDVREQLCGTGGDYSSSTPPVGSVDPRIKNTGFVSSFADKYPSADFATPMKCFTSDQLLS